MCRLLTKYDKIEQGKTHFPIVYYQNSTVKTKKKNPPHMMQRVLFQKQCPFKQSTKSKTIKSLVDHFYVLLVFLWEEIIYCGKICLISLYIW